MYVTKHGIFNTLEITDIKKWDKAWYEINTGAFKFILGYPFVINDSAIAEWYNVSMKVSPLKKFFIESISKYDLNQDS